MELLICASCQVDPDDDDDGPRPGALLAEGLEANLPEGVRLTRVDCLSNCKRGCTVELRGPGRWTYVYGNLDPETHLDTLREGVARYRGAADGIIPWRDRPDHFRKNCIVRIPPQEGSHG
ncbi:hypothetical protein RGUI_4257 (plasmid) [Rhodovulum sp. P5]|nr:hypothetical protein RGUI_4257 [Rhodovulum sp. P5]